MSLNLWKYILSFNTVKHNFAFGGISEVTHALKKRITVVNNTALTSSWDFSYRNISGHTGYFTLGTSKTLLTSSLLVTVNYIVHFDVFREIYHSEFSTGNVGHKR